MTERDFELFRKVFDVNSKEEDETICNHLNSVDNGEFFTCEKCDLVMYKLCDDIQDYKRVSYRTVYDPSKYKNDPYKNVELHCRKFMTRVKLKLSNDLSETVIAHLYLIKEQNNFKSINYAIMLHLLFVEDEYIQSKIKPFLPKSKSSWEKNREMFKVYKTYQNHSDTSVECV